MNIYTSSVGDVVQPCTCTQNGARTPNIHVHISKLELDCDENNLSTCDRMNLDFFGSCYATKQKLFTVDFLFL